MLAVTKQNSTKLYFMLKMYVKYKNKHVLNWTYVYFVQSYRVATLSTFYLTLSGIIIPSFKPIGQF